MPKTNLCRPDIHPNTKTIYNAIRQGASLFNYRQADLAKILKVKQNTVSYHLKNYSFDDEQINTLLDHFGLEIKVCGKES